LPRRSDRAGAGDSAGIGAGDSAGIGAGRPGSSHASPTATTVKPIDHQNARSNAWVVAVAPLP
jgi:hypothetical protein